MIASAQLISNLSIGYESLLAKYDPHTAIKMLDKIDSGEHYHFVSEELSLMWEGILQEFGSGGFGTFQRIVMLCLIEDFENRAKNIHYIDEILQCFDFSFARIKENIENPKCTDYDSVNDLLLKDLALCRQVLFPAGAQVVQPHSGFSRSLMFRGGIKQFWSMLRLLKKTGGNTGYYFYHTHLSELQDFNARGWDNFYLRIADMLKINLECRGLVSTPWFLDPALKKVSPHLSYIRDRPEQNGASFFFIRIDPDSGALSKSATRRRLYAEGKYIPKSYCMVWPREEMIEWASRFRERHTGLG